MNISLIIREISDTYVQEDFSRIEKALLNDVITNGNWTYVEINIPRGTQLFEFRHNLDFIPKDIIGLSAVGDQNYEFRFDKFNASNIYVDAAGPVYIRCLLGRYKDINAQSSNFNYAHIPFNSGIEFNGTIDFGDRIAGIDQEYLDFGGRV